MSLNTILLEIGDYIPYLYSLVFLVSIAMSRKLTSLSIIVILLAVAEFAMHSARDPIRELLNDKTIEYIVRLSAWIVFWTLVDLFIIIVLQKVHQWLNLAKTRELMVVQGCYLLIMCLHLMFFVNAWFVQISFIDTAYRLAIPIVNITIAVYLLVELLLYARNSRADKTDIPHAF